MGSAHPLNAPRTAGSPSAAANQTNWLRLLDVVRLPQLQDDPRYATNAGRMRHLPELEAVLNAEFRKRPGAEWLALLERAVIPAGPVHGVRRPRDVRERADARAA